MISKLSIQQQSYRSDIFCGWTKVGYKPHVKWDLPLKKNASNDLTYSHMCNETFVQLMVFVIIRSINQKMYPPRDLWNMRLLQCVHHHLVLKLCAHGESWKHSLSKLNNGYIFRYEICSHVTYLWTFSCVWGLSVKILKFNEIMCWCLYIIIIKRTHRLWTRLISVLHFV